MAFLAIFIKFITRIGFMAAAPGQVRIVSALKNIIAVALTAVFAYFAYWLICNHNNVVLDAGEAGCDSGSGGESCLFAFCAGSSAVIAMWAGIIICIILAVFCFLYGTLAQIALVIITIAAVIRRKVPEETKYNVIAMLISVASLAVFVAGFVMAVKFIG